jgi:hypothetical protein
MVGETFLKIMCDNDEFYCPAEFQHEIVCILVYTKMTDAENMKVF